MTIFNFSAAVSISSLFLLPRNVDSFCGIHNFCHQRSVPADGVDVTCTPTALYLSSTTADYYYYDDSGGGTGIGRQSLYNILGLDNFATSKDIKGAFRKLAKKYHPDLNKSKESTEIFQEVNKAYEVLKDPQMRLKYDMQFSGLENFRSTSASSSCSSNAQQNEYVIEIEDLEGYYDPFCHGTTSSTSRERSRRYDDSDYTSWVKTWEPQSHTQNEQIPCDQPNCSPTAVGSWGGSIPFDERVKSRMDSERYRRQQKAAAENTAANAAHTNIPFEDVVRAKMGDRDISIDEGPYSNSKSIPFDEFVREKMNFDSFASGENNRKNQQESNNNNNNNKSCDEYVDPFMGRTSLQDTHIKCDQDHENFSPYSSEQRTEFYASSPPGFINEQVVEGQPRSSRRSQSTSPSYSNQSSFFTEDDGGKNVQQPKKCRMQSQPQSLVMEASDLWQPISRSLRP